MARHEVKSEKPLHRAIKEHDIVEGGAKGAVTGTVIGAGLKHLGAKHVGPLSGAAAGTLLGLARGHFKGKERVLKDTTQQERMEARRMKKSSLNAVVLQAFGDEIVKSANAAAQGVGIFQGLGQRVARGIGGAVRRVGGSAHTVTEGVGEAAKKTTTYAANPNNPIQRAASAVKKWGTEAAGSEANFHKALGGVAAAGGVGTVGYVGHKVLS